MSRPHKRNRENTRTLFGNLRRELEEHIKANGEGWIESLGELGKPVREWVDAVIESLGGETKVSPQKKTMIILAARSVVLCESVDRYLFSMPSVINRSRKQLFAIVMQRKELVSALSRQLTDIGLEPIRTDEDALLAEIRERYLARKKIEAPANPPNGVSH